MLGTVLNQMDLRKETRAAMAALRAIRPIVERRHGAKDVTEKAPNDIVTATDVLVQNGLEEVLREHEPDIVFVGEEGPPSAAHHARRMWLVDPICGTSNYATGLPLFATNIALVEDGEIVSAAVADGATGQVCVAERSRGAWLVDGDALHALKVDSGYRMVSIDPDILGGEGIRDFPSAFALAVVQRRRWDVRALASTVALTYLAMGKLAAAVYAPLGVSALHVAAGALLAREAGALVTDHLGAEWTLDRPILVAAATPELHEELRELAAQVYNRLIG